MLLQVVLELLLPHRGARNEPIMPCASLPGSTPLANDKRHASRRWNVPKVSIPDSWHVLREVAREQVRVAAMAIHVRR